MLRWSVGVFQEGTMWKPLNQEEEMHHPLFDPILKKSHKHAKKKIAKIIEALLTLLSFIIICCPRKKDAGNGKRFEELPNEIILKILSYCDFTTKMNMRAISRRFYSLVEKAAFSLVRRNLVGGVEIWKGEKIENTLESDASSSYGRYHVTLRRPLKRAHLKMPSDRLTNIMRHVSVCHSLKLCGLPLDEVMAADILDASFRTVNDVIIDRVHAVTAETLKRLVRKTHPSKSLIFCNHSTLQASEAIVPDLLLACSASNIAIEPSVTLLHRKFDDAALVRLVISDLAIQRAIRLPLCAITHNGINKAAQAFYKRCCEVMAELTSEMRAPQWKISVSFPSSLLIDRSLIEIPIEMQGLCTVWGYLPSYNDSFTVEVRVGGMNLRIIVEPA
ncbi:unnamed protein product [Cylicocyclus nassatus]|uniref:F-box domain-containing protein n=1 Tax=Cylicocyclus nassatus TaxID=53992 RepID=A0AA36M6K7_CYLNA|nr:unnamed protein product [Cylicocyclus nassatus]